MILREATMADVAALQELIGLSVRGLSVGHYTDAQIEAALDDVFGVDNANSSRTVRTTSSTAPPARLRLVGGVRAEHSSAATR